MLYTLNLDNENFVLSISHTQNDNVELDLEQVEMQYLNAYQYLDGSLVLNEEKKQELINQENQKEIQDEINELRKKLSDTDYIWNVIREGDRTEEYYSEIISNRHTWRLRIRELENK